MTIHDDALSAFRKVYDTELDARQSKVDSLSASLVQLRSEYVAAIEQRDSAILEVASLTSTIETLKTTIARLEARIKELETPPSPVIVRPTGPGFVPAESLAKKSSVTATFATAPIGSQITLLPEVLEFGDFTMYDTKTVGGYGLGLYLVKGLLGLRGSGIDKTIVRQKKGASTRKSQVPPNLPPGSVNYLDAGTNNLHAVRLGNNDGAVTVTDLTIEGTDQGHEYNGLLIPTALGSIIDRVKITGIPGSGGANPGETFGLSLYRSSKSTVRNFEFDGRRDGVAVSAAGIGVNFSDDVLIEDAYLHDTKHGSGIAWFTCTNATMRNVKFRNIGGIISANFERMAGTVTLEKCDFGAGGTQAHMMLQSDTTSSVVRIIDPIFEGPKFKLRAGGTYQGNPSKQNVADIKLIVNGVDRPDHLAILR